MQAKRTSVISFAVGVLMAFGCAAPELPPPFDLKEVATDKTYGYSEHSPVLVGGAAEGQQIRHREAFFRALRGPQGQLVSYVSQGTCCAVGLARSGASKGDLEVFLVTYPGIPKPVILYLDYYQLDLPKAPLGFGTAPTPAGFSSPSR